MLFPQLEQVGRCLLKCGVVLGTQHTGYGPSLSQCVPVPRIQRHRGLGSPFQLHVRAP